MKNYTVYTNKEGLKAIHIKATKASTGATQLFFQDGEQIVAVFELSQIIGYVQDDHFGG
jgi:hypothetical protein